MKLKLTKPAVIAIATIAVLTGTGVAAAYSDIQIIPAGPRVIRDRPQPPVQEEPASEPITENENSDTSFTASPENDTPLVSSPEQTQTPVSEEQPNEPAPEADPTPEPLPAPSTPITHVENPNTVLGNNTAGNVSHN